MKHLILKLQFSVLLASCFLLVAFSVEGATLYFLPQAQTIYQGDTFIVEVRIDTEDEEINVVEASLMVPAELLEVVDFSKGGSVLNLFVKEPEFKEGIISFAGGIPNGFRGNDLLVKINFLGKEIGEAKVVFQEGSKVLLNDGQGTRALLSLSDGDYQIIKKPETLAAISSTSHPDQNRWVKADTLHLHWNLTEGAEYSFVLTQDPLTEPDEIPDMPEPEEGLLWMGDMEYANLEDGIYYFFLRQATRDKRQELLFGPKVTFRAMIDATPPEDFQPQIVEIERKKYLAFAASDKTSGVDRYEILETSGKQQETGEWKVAKNPYLLSNQRAKNKILVKAVDKAGNEKVIEMLPPPHKATWKDIVFPLLILIGIGIIWWIIRKVIKATRGKRQEAKF